MVPDDIVDLAFRIDCRSLPLDHADTLPPALQQVLPWLAEETRAGIHLIHGAESGNGWMRPEDPAHEVLHVSRRTRMKLRLPKERIEAARSGLSGQMLDIGGHALRIGEAAVKSLTACDIVFARYVVGDEAQDEESFVRDVVAMLGELGIRARKVLCGRSHRLRVPDGEWFTRSVMIADLDVKEAVRLQETGLGPGRMYGCGLFLPHKGIAAVGAAQE